MSETASRYSKIASAIYLVTSFFADQEPLKWRLRSLSVDLAARSPANKAALGRDLISLFGIARTAGLVSDANHDILTRELSRLKGEETEALPALFASEEKLPQPQRESPALRELERPAAELQVMKDNLSDNKDKPEEKPDLKGFGAVSVKKNRRQSAIIALLKRKKEIMIKDVSPLIPGCSEKTIQRELLDMVSHGIVRKIGEKRWTRYTLA